MTITDLIIIGLSIFLIIRGASRGFVNSLLGPFSIIVASIISIIYYQQTKEMIISLIIGLAGPLVLQFSLKFLINMWAQATKTAMKPNFLDRVGGSILTLIWGGLFIVFFLILIAVVPPMGKTLTAVHADVTQSATYALVKPLQDTFFAVPKNTATTQANPANNDIQSMAQDPRIQKVLQDPDVQKDIEDHDFVKLMRNPKMLDLTRQLMSDPAALKKMMSIYSNNLSKLQQSPQPNTGN